MFKLSKNRWVSSCVRKVADVCQECDSCAAVDGAKMSPADRKRVQELCRQIGEILAKY